MDNYTFTDDKKLAIAQRAGMVKIDAGEAIIVAPPAADTLTDDDWLVILGIASELRGILERRGYRVKG